ncbi:Calcipressin-domain-containing protein [Myriangium duriaei CBS 260.36]|uniref:Calcipressin-domain-containing protein n=1 Tax=Myriangium duriaei CBS 260.36 TaxID=1168546 RepID=A0A9P4J3K0_9PEZI|nr:Calcipressin-domain-containing protein [Myriangium duriaei CBS 260.36]
MSVETSPSPSASPVAQGMKRRHSPSLSLDLSDLPPLTTPSNPSNTLIITNLSDPTIFAPQNLQSIRDAISAQAELHSFAPLKSFRRIIAVFSSVADATHVRQLLDGETVLSNRVRVYFGEPTALQEKDQHLAAPQSQKLFFISPPPSPPVGWEMRNEEPPNKEVHADDLATALNKLNARGRSHSLSDFPPSPTSTGSANASYAVNGRGRSGTIVYDPVENGSHPDLPAIAVQDTSDDDLSSAGEKKIMAHTARPPVELMES